MTIRWPAAPAEATGLSRQTLAEGLSESLADFAASVDICLMYDAPTSADLEFLRNGVALLNPVPEPLYCAEAMQANASVVPRDDVEATLHRLADLASDPLLARPVDLPAPTRPNGAPFPRRGRWRPRATARYFSPLNA